MKGGRAEIELASCSVVFVHLSAEGVVKEGRAEIDLASCSMVFVHLSAEGVVQEGQKARTRPRSSEEIP